MLEVKIVDSNYRRYSHDLLIIHNGKEIGRYSDGMEPEDVSFYRDLSWIAEAIEESYELGKKEKIEEN